VDEQPPRLYHWDQEWQIHMPLETRGTRQLKFVKQGTWSTHTLPTTALRVTCTYERTHIRPSRQHGNAPIKQVPQLTWNEHITNLPQDKQWALAHLSLLDNGTLLSEAIRSRQACAVCNGSFKEKFGMATWVFYHGETNDTLGLGKLITPGYPEDQCSYWSEMSGIYGIASTIRELALYHDLQGGTLTVACDGKSALHQCFKPWNSNLLAKHFDLIQAAQATIKATPIKWAWEHVQGHQDEHDQPLTPTEQHNVDMDREAKAHWTENHTN